MIAIFFFQEPPRNQLNALQEVAAKLSSAREQKEQVCLQCSLRSSRLSLEACCIAAIDSFDALSVQELMHEFDAATASAAEGFLSKISASAARHMFVLILLRSLAFSCHLMVFFALGCLFFSAFASALCCVSGAAPSVRFFLCALLSVGSFFRVVLVLRYLFCCMQALRAQAFERVSQASLLK